MSETNLFDVTLPDGSVAEVSAPPVPPCPSWCTHAALLPDHGYDSASEGMPVRSYRFHESDPFASVFLSQEEHNVGGVVSYSEVVISASLAGADLVNLTEAQAREAAAQLLATVDELNRRGL